jgi:hypothetical protein
MLIKCPKFEPQIGTKTSCKWVKECAEVCEGNTPYIFVSIPTADLIAELEKRRPNCMTCKDRTSHNPDRCVNCLWGYGHKIEDNFKPSK